MKEQLYTIPVNDAFSSDCECPICKMRQELEQNAIDYTMGPSYMEDDNRAETDRLGFCPHHIRLLYAQKNRLGLALMLKTHTDKTIRDLETLPHKSNTTTHPSLFKKGKNNALTDVGRYISELEHNCFICNRIEATFQRYLNTIFHLWKKDTSFHPAVAASKGFCTYHYGVLYEEGLHQLNKKEYADFIECIDQVYFNNMKRVNDDLEWFINKFDYRFEKEPWKNSKDAIPRAIIKTNHSILE